MPSKSIPLSFGHGIATGGDATPPRPQDDAMQAGAPGASRGPGRDAILFITDEIFLPQSNGSGSVYARVAQQYRQAGHDVYCLSFYRDRGQASDPARHAAYHALFKDFLFLPGWNRGGGALGYAGMGWRELSRWTTGNVFSSHPLLLASRPQVIDQLMSFIASNGIRSIYFHKPHTLLLCEAALPRLRGQRRIVDLHDDFVARDDEYAAAYAAVFQALPWRSIVTQFGAMYLRHRFTHTNQQRSRRRELSLLRQCDEVLVASDREYDTYAAMPALAGRVRHQPWPYPPSQPARPRTGQPDFDAGFIGADNAMNLDAVLHLRDDILPRVRARKPDFRILLAGTMTRKAAPLLVGVPGVETCGRLDDLAMFYDAVRVAAVPVRHGTGVSIKAMEALAYGVPLVTTSTGVRGQDLETLLGNGVAIADHPAAFAEALLRQARATSTADRGGETAEASAAPPEGAAGRRGWVDFQSHSTAAASLHVVRRSGHRSAAYRNHPPSSGLSDG